VYVNMYNKLEGLLKKIKKNDGTLSKGTKRSPATGRSAFGAHHYKLYAVNRSAKPFSTVVFDTVIYIYIYKAWDSNSD
jgi:hypothetical protein